MGYHCDILMICHLALACASTRYMVLMSFAPGVRSEVSEYHEPYPVALAHDFAARYLDNAVALQARQIGLKCSAGCRHSRAIGKAGAVY